jgi:predicted nicotinamide N-methyase
MERIKVEYTSLKKYPCKFLNNDLFIAMDSSNNESLDITTDFTRINALYDFFSINKEILKDKVVVDFGAGNGALPVALNKLGAKKVIAIDYNDNALYSCKESVIKYNVNIETIKNIDYNMIYGDVLISSGVFEVCYDYKKNWEYTINNMKKIPTFICSARLCKNTHEDIRVINPKIVYQNKNINIFNELDDWFYESEDAKKTSKTH